MDYEHIWTSIHLCESPKGKYEHFSNKSWSIQLLYSYISEDIKWLEMSDKSRGTI